MNLITDEFKEYDWCVDKDFIEGVFIEKKGNYPVFNKSLSLEIIEDSRPVLEKSIIDADNYKKICQGLAKSLGLSYDHDKIESGYLVDKFIYNIRNEFKSKFKIPLIKSCPEINKWVTDSKKRRQYGLIKRGTVKGRVSPLENAREFITRITQEAHIGIPDIQDIKEANNALASALYKYEYHQSKINPGYESLFLDKKSK